MIEFADEDRIFLGHEARQLLNNRLVKEAFAELERMALEKLLACDLTDDANRFRLAERIRVIRDLRDELMSVQITGQQMELRQETD